MTPSDVYVRPIPIKLLCPQISAGWQSLFIELKVKLGKAHDLVDGSEIPKQPPGRYETLEILGETTVLLKW